MPLLNVEIVGEAKIPGLAHSLANAAAKILETPPGRTWVKIHFLPREQYAENGGVGSDIRPVFVSVLLGKRKGQAQSSAIASEIAATFSRILNRPHENIHVIFEPAATGRIAFGGKLLTE